MKAFVSALIAVVLIAVGVHWLRGRLAPQWNTAAVAAAPDSVRLDPGVQPALPTLPGLAPAASLPETERDVAGRLEECARLRAQVVYRPSPFAGHGAGAWVCPEALPTAGEGH